MGKLERLVVVINHSRPFYPDWIEGTLPRSQLHLS